MHPVKEYVETIVTQNESDVDLLDPENQNILIRRVWVFFGKDVKATSIIKASQKLRAI